ncbi:TraR/DksA C4-type zinc finger protein [Desulfovibrio subterraneus]|jgi:DnaK suppressor protein|uniref:TraR/DksA family transcriptional regulator n=1 Tax=Desulfovibrio subterraneus TaxID=2718620 RepID=UPI0022B8E1AE|nr:TraR/DksA C4-type zinc finger protein [Desulfovibrio subterraneus]WBF66798.1 TraR/DksA C4-type zinc finger protein [Desulfovibrio subterraneus]
MTEAERDTIRRKIVQEIERLKPEIERLKEITKPVAPDDAIGRISRMDNIVNNSVNKAALGKAVSRLAGLEYALAQCGNPDFGTCIECGAAIPTARLLAMPESAMCVACAE